MRANPKYKKSLTVEILRSQIQFAPYNPKNHTKELVKEIKDNIKNVAFLGGIVWNVTTGNLIDGHKRIMALDVIHKYDGTPEKDYSVKVEKIELDHKTEMEQNIFQTRSRTELDLQIVGTFINEIDHNAAGLTPIDLSLIAPIDTVGMTDEMEDVFTKKNAKEAVSEEQAAENKEAVKELKKEISEKSAQTAKDNLLSYLTLNFTSFEDKQEFMERFGLDPYQTFIDGKEFGEMCEAII